MNSWVFWRRKFMQNTIEIACPQEILPGLHLDAEQFAGQVKAVVVPGWNGG